MDSEKHTTAMQKMSTTRGGSMVEVADLVSEAEAGWHCWLAKRAFWLGPGNVGEAGTPHAGHS